jgi:hypothetical protein
MLALPGLALKAIAVVLFCYESRRAPEDEKLGRIGQTVFIVLAIVPLFLELVSSIWIFILSPLNALRRRLVAAQCRAAADFIARATEYRRAL